ncbi:MAG: protein-L-isoaspartate(D-aspartate) O-methyltransferase [Acidobacteriaceae bacterium]
MVESQLRARGIRDQRVLDAMTRVPRHMFVAEQYCEQAYEDHPIPIGEGQTTSQPYIVAVMLEALQLKSTDRVLEVGAGTGYQTALLAQLALQVYSVERHCSLAGQTKILLAALACANVDVIVGDGTEGLPQFAPFDAIIISAAAPDVPKPLFEQLAEGGRMILPVGPESSQQLQLIIKIAGRADVTPLEACRFVPLIGAHGYSVTS